MGELLAIVAMIAILAALLFPVLLKAKNAAKRTACVSNLTQIGAAFGLYMSDYDDKWPLGVDPADKFTPEIWAAYPEFQRRIPSLPFMHEVLDPYVKTADIWRCPEDQGLLIDDVSFMRLNSTPSSFERFGTSYYYRTELTVRQLSGTAVKRPADINVFFDGSGAWHTSVDMLRPGDTQEQTNRKLKRFRYNVLFGDFHAKNVSRDQYMEAWNIDP